MEYTEFINLWHSLSLDGKQQWMSDHLPYRQAFQPELLYPDEDEINFQRMVISEVSNNLIHYYIYPCPNCCSASMVHIRQHYFLCTSCRQVSPSSKLEDFAIFLEEQEEREQDYQFFIQEQREKSE